MKIKIKRFDKNIPLPEYKTDGATGMDLAVRKDTTIKANQVGLIPLNVAIEMPKNVWSIVAARSSLHKFGLIPANGIGVIDSDYRGDNDEYKLLAFNFTDSDVTVKKGIRVAQVVFVNLTRANLEEVEELDNPNRGGFGSTGIK